MVENYQKLVEETKNSFRTSSTLNSTSVQTDNHNTIDFLNIESTEAIKSLTENYSEVIFNTLKNRKTDQNVYVSSQFDQELCKKMMMSRLQNVKRHIKDKKMPQKCKSLENLNNTQPQKTITTIESLKSILKEKSSRLHSPSCRTNTNSHD